MGLLVNIYRPTRDCSAGAVSDIKHARMHLNVANIPGPFDPKPDDTDVVVLVPGPYGTPILVPAVLVDGDWQAIPSNTTEYAGPVYGGNNADASDARWDRAVMNMVYDRLRSEGMLSSRVTDIAETTGHDRRGQWLRGIPTSVRIHDRCDTWAVYEMLSR